METHFENIAITHHINQITFYKKNRLATFTALSLSEQATVFNELSVAVQQDLLDTLPYEKLIALLDHFDLHHAQQYLRRIQNPRRQKHIASKLKQELRDKATHFLRFHPKAAFDMVHLNYILIAHTSTIGETALAVDTHYREVGKIPEVLIHKNGVCIGKIEPGTLIREDNTKLINQFAVPVKTIEYKASVQEIIRTITDTNTHQLVVLDTDDSVIGIVYGSDVRNLFNTYPAESLYGFAGLDENEHPFDSIMSKVDARAIWLLINLATVFLAASVIGAFEETLATISILAIYIPVIIGMGSNAGTQTLAVFIRGIALGEISLKKAWPAIRNEISAVALQGIVHGTIVTVIASLFGHGPAIGLIAAAAILANLVAGVAAGSLIPLIMKLYGKDPARASGVVLTTLTDMVGLFVLFGLATVFLL